MAEVSYLPIWKEGATAVERFNELAMIANKHPEWFSRLVVLYAEETDEGIKLRTVCTKLTTYELVGMLADAQRSALE